MAERRNAHNFKEGFLHSFLSEDYDNVAARRLLERKQGTKESIRDFAFHHEALCLRWRKEMSGGSGSIRVRAGLQVLLSQSYDGHRL